MFETLQVTLINDPNSNKHYVLVSTRVCIALCSIHSLFPPVATSPDGCMVFHNNTELMLICCEAFSPSNDLKVGISVIFHFASSSTGVTSIFVWPTPPSLASVVHTF